MNTLFILLLEISHSFILSVSEIIQNDISQEYNGLRSSFHKFLILVYYVLYTNPMHSPNSIEEFADIIFFFHLLLFLFGIRQDYED